jgi:hypothetical protein
MCGWVGQTFPISPRRVRPFGTAEAVPFPIKVETRVRIKINLKGNGQECPSHTGKVKIDVLIWRMKKPRSLALLGMIGLVGFLRVHESSPSDQNGTDWAGAFWHTTPMSNQTIAEYLDEERQKFAATQLREEEEAARIQPLQHGHHRTAKQPKLELVPAVNATGKKKKKKKIVAVARTKARAARKIVAKKMVAKIRKRA